MAFFRLMAYRVYVKEEKRQVNINKRGDSKIAPTKDMFMFRRIYHSNFTASFPA